MKIPKTHFAGKSYK